MPFKSGYDFQIRTILSLSNSSGSSIAFPPLLTPSPPFSGYNSTGGDAGGQLRTPDMVSAYDDLIRFVC